MKKHPVLTYSEPQTGFQKQCHALRLRLLFHQLMLKAGTGWGNAMLGPPTECCNAPLQHRSLDSCARNSRHGEHTQPHTPLQEEQKDPVLQLRHFTQYNWNLGTHILEQHSLTAQQCSVGQPALSISAPPGAPTALLQGTSTHDKCLKGRKKEKHH